MRPLTVNLVSNFPGNPGNPGWKQVFLLFFFPLREGQNTIKGDKRKVNWSLSLTMPCLGKKERAKGLGFLCPAHNQDLLYEKSSLG